MGTLQPRRLVIVDNPSSSRSLTARPVVNYLMGELSHAVRIETGPSMESNRESVAKVVEPGDVVAVVSGDGVQNDAINGLLRKPSSDVVVVCLPAGGENDTSYAAHGARTLEELGVITRLACGRDNLPTTAIRPFHISADGRDLGYGIVSAGLGMVADAAQWLESPEVKYEFNKSGRGALAKAALAKKYFDEKGKYYHMPPVRHNGGIERYHGAAIIVMNAGRMAGTWRNVMARHAIRGDEFVVGHYQRLWSLPRAAVFGVQSLSGMMLGSRRQREEITFDKGRAPLQIDGEPRGHVQQVVFEKEPSGPFVQVLDATRFLDQLLAA